MKQNWDRAIASVFRWEGGDAVRDNEPGGAVSRGCSLAVYQEDHPGATVQDLFNAPNAVIEEIYARRYAKPIQFDELPAGLDAVMLHGAVMFGPTGVRRLLGECGDITGRPALEVAGELVIRMMHNKMHRKDGTRFMPGWSDRFLDVYRIARELH